MKYNVGDKVRIKSLDWYNENKDEDGDVPCNCNILFLAENKKYLGTTQTVERVYICEGQYVGNYIYKLKGIENTDWTNEMIEGLAEEETKSNILEEAKNYWDSIKDAWICPEGFEFSDENGNAINTTKITLRKKKEIIPNLQLDSIRTVREYDTVHSRIWLEIYEDNPELCIFTHLLVDEDHRQKGYGTKALEQAEIISKDLGCDTIHLKVKTDSWMHNWYLRSGYKFLTNAEDNYTWLTKSI